MTPDEILRSRLANQHLATPLLDDPGQLVAHLGAVQAQDYSAAKWALALRLRNATGDLLEAAVTAGKILRTHVLRPTWHFVAPADIRWMLALTAPRIRASATSSMRDLGLDEAFLRRSETAILRALEGGHCLTRAELAVALREAGLGVQDGMTMAHVTLAAELDGLVCSGPRRGTQQTYALLDERVPAAPTLTIDEALAELIWRYFSSHGPALVQDCAWWSGMPIGQVRRGLELNATRLSPETVDGRTYWFRPAARPRTPEKVHLLPNFDEYTVAYRERDLYYDRVLNWTGNPRNDVPFRNVIVVNGRVVGHWSRTLHQQKLTIYTHWAIEASEAEVRELDAATQRYGAFLQPCVL